MGRCTASSGAAGAAVAYPRAARPALRGSSPTCFVLTNSRASDLRDFVVEVSRGVIGRERVRSVSLDDIRAGGPDRVAEILDAMRGADVAVVNSLTYQDLETVALAALTVQDGGRSLLYRSGPSFRWPASQRSGTTRAGGPVWASATIPS